MLLEVGKVVIEGRMDDSVGRVRGGVQLVQIVQIPADNLRPGARQGLGAVGLTAEPDHPMAGGDKFRNEIGANEARGAGQEHIHLAHSFEGRPRKLRGDATAIHPGPTFVRSLSDAPAKDRFLPIAGVRDVRLRRALTPLHVARLRAKH